MPTIAQGHPEGPVKTYAFTPTGTATAPLWLFRIGEAVFVGASPELSTDTALDIRERSGFRYAFVASMFEGGAKNMADRWNYAHVTYEAVDSGYAPRRGRGAGRPGDTRRPVAGLRKGSP